jgi:predicted nucleotidyltransferase
MKQEYLGELCKKLIKYDQDIVEIIQFGSSIYAPEYSKDIDLLVITKKAKEYSKYLDIANPKNAPINVDILVFNIDDKPRKELLRGILGAFKILYGSGEYLLKYAKELGDPTFEEAKSSLRVATSLLKLALETVNPLDKDRLCREAFDALFHAARIASMVYLSTEISRWGFIKRELPEPYKTNFNEFISTLHINYFYNGNYPRDKVKEEFYEWFKKVETYVNSLESKIKKNTTSKN